MHKISGRETSWNIKA